MSPLALTFCGRTGPGVAMAPPRDHPNSAYIPSPLYNLPCLSFLPHLDVLWLDREAAPKSWNALTNNIKLTSHGFWALCPLTRV